MASIWASSSLPGNGTEAVLPAHELSYGRSMGWGSGKLLESQVTSYLQSHTKGCTCLE